MDTGRGRLLVKLACKNVLESSSTDTNQAENASISPQLQSTRQMQYNIESGNNSLMSDTVNEEKSSDLEDNRMDIVNEMENCLNLSDIFAGPSTSTNILHEVLVNDEADNLGNDCLFESDFSDVDPDYAPPVSSSTSSDSDATHNVVIPESPEVSLESHDSSDGIVMALLNDILEKVWISVRPLQRRKKKRTLEWKNNVNKLRKIEGMPYETRGKMRPAKIPRSVNCEKCKYKCTNSFSENERKDLCRNFYSMDFNGRKNFILSCIAVQPIKTRQLQKTSNRKERSFSKKCYFKKENEQVQVCQKFFTATLCISGDVIFEAIEKANTLGFYDSEDKRGKRSPPNKTKKENINFVKEHIESFPTMESHYCRKDTKRKYLSADIKSISNMYRLYQEHCKEHDRTAVSEPVYRNIFCSEYNLSFFNPKKDLCMLCTSYNKSDVEKKTVLENEYQEHIQRKNISLAAKEADKERSNIDETFMSITVDLQAVLQIPSGGESILYYMRKLVLYNFTIYEARLPNEAYCLCWSEINGKKGSCEIGTCLNHYLFNELSPTVKHLSIFSDTCSGQNRNQYISAFLLWAVQKHEHLEIIEQKFLESGHSHMEVDSMHAAIENASKNKSINSVTDWKNVFKAARKTKTKKNKKNEGKLTTNSYKVKEIKYNEMLDLKKMSTNLLKNKTKDNMNEKVNWLKIKRIKYVKGQYATIYFNYDLSEEFRFINVSAKANTKKTRSSMSNPSSIDPQLPEQLEPLYQHSLPISAAKKKDLETLCKKGIFPEELHPYIKSLRSEKNLPAENSEESS